jgi:hypothetical protein
LFCRKTHFGFSGGARTILVDCTTISPLAKIIKDYKPGKAADYATKRKEKYYQRFLDIKTTDRCTIFFVAVETSGGLGREARNYVKRVLNLKLTPAELGALMYAFDDAGDGTINCTEFTKNFLKLGFNERELELKEMQEKQRAMEEKRKREETLKKEEQERKEFITSNL